MDVAGAGKDTFYEHVLKLRGFLHWQITLHYKVWLVATGKGSCEEIFYTKPSRVRKVLQAEIITLRLTFDVYIWLDIMTTWLHALHKIVWLVCSQCALTCY